MAAIVLVVNGHTEMNAASCMLTIQAKSSYLKLARKVTPGQQRIVSMENELHKVCAECGGVYDKTRDMCKATALNTSSANSDILSWFLYSILILRLK